MSQMVPDGATADDGDDAAPPQECLPMLDSLLELSCSQTETINHVELEEIRAWPASESARDVILGPQEVLYCSDETCCTCGQEGLRIVDLATSHPIHLGTSQPLSLQRSSFGTTLREEVG